MLKQINKNSLIILVIIEMGYLLRGHLPSMCYYTPFLSNYIKYPATYFFFFLDYLFLFLAICVEIFGISNIKTLLKVFGLVQPLKLITDITVNFIPDFAEGSYWTYPLLNFYLLIINIILINTYFLNQSKINRQFLKPVAFCIGSIVFQFLIYLIPTAIYFCIQFFHIQAGKVIENIQISFVMIIVQFVLCNILQVIGGNLLARYGISMAVQSKISRGKKHNLIIYAITLLGSLLFLFYSWINMPNTIIEVIQFGFEMNH